MSAHLTVGIHALTRDAIVHALAALAADDPELRRALPFALDLGSDDIRDEVEATVAALARALGAIDTDAVVERLRASLVEMTPPAPIAPVAQVVAAHRP